MARLLTADFHTKATKTFEDAAVDCMKTMARAWVTVDPSVPEKYNIDVDEATEVYRKVDKLCAAWRVCYVIAEEKKNGTRTFEDVLVDCMKTMARTWVTIDPKPQQFFTVLQGCCIAGRLSLERSFGGDGGGPLWQQKQATRGEQAHRFFSGIGTARFRD
ncbi:hypothetical protein HPB50_019137 [Hyalomma asiaticum]|uniref:Uncharacterized protein n=1 Tax=Hyalomma asiaticum TaxID=266040 RepID=A0ACB7SH50_HYAAI|nr:hypothetical protein HPB50_019137 [Hyalomma asiaticum]